MMSAIKKIKPPDLKSVAETKEKASHYVGSKETNKMVKQAILRELNSHLLSIKPQEIVSRDVAARNKKSSSKERSLNPYKDVAFEKQKDAKAFVERNGEISSTVKSRIPRPIRSELEHGKGTRAFKPGKRIECRRIPGYDWDKHGRIVELKIRFLARKYLRLWIRKTYGGITPREARMHYEKKLMKKAFVCLEDLWWNSRKGWKLNIRAEYHDRYRSWKCYFKLWKLFVLHQKEKRVKASLATKFDEMKILRKSFASLKLFHNYKRNRRKEQNVADHYQKLRATRLVFYQWLQTLQQSRINRSLELQALSFWTHNVKSRALAKWKISKVLKDAENEQFATATKHFNTCMMNKCLEGLKIYIKYRHKKNYVKEFAERHFERNLKRFTVRKWNFQLKRRMEIIELEDRIDFTSRKFILRAYFIRWTSYIEDVNNIRMLMTIATKHYNRRLKAKCFGGLRRAACQRELKIERQQRAFVFRKNKLLSESLSHWLARCEKSEELKLYPLTKIGRAFRRKCLLKRSVDQWCKYLMWKRKRKRMYDAADKQFEKNALPRYFVKLYEYKETRKIKQERKFAADYFNRELMHAKYFYTWLKQSRLNQDLRLLERMAILHDEEVSKRKTLFKWRNATKLVLDIHQHEMIAEAHIERTMKMKYIKKLKMHAYEEKKRRHQESIAVNHDEKQKLNFTFRSWKMYTSYKRKKSRKRKLAEDHYRRILLSKIMFNMKVYLDQRRRINKEATRRNHCYNQVIQRWAFDRWYQNAAETKDEKCKLKLANDFAVMRIKQETFMAWRSCAALEIHKRWKVSRKVQKIRESLDRGKKRRAFNAIIEFSRSSKKRKILNEIAYKFHHQRLKQKYLAGWKEYIAIVFRKLLLQRQSEIFYMKKNFKSFFQQWKQQHELAVQERNRTNVVLWMWSSNLQRKTFRAWKDYIEFKKEKKSKEMHALVLRREQLLENCVQRWLRYSTDMMEFRTKIAQAREIKGTVKRQERARKYAMMWYNKSRKQKSKAFLKNKKEKHDHLETDDAVLLPGNVATLIGLPKVTERKSVIQAIPIFTKEKRPMPRKPNYLRDSFDLGQFTESPLGDEAMTTHCESVDESKPRPAPPQPAHQTSAHKHLSDRINQLKDSLTLCVSSDDDNLTTEQKKFTSTTVQRQNIVLLPPSSFKKGIKDQKEEFAVSNTTMSPVHLRTADDERHSEADESSESGADDTDPDSECDSLEGISRFHGTDKIFQEMAQIRKELEDYQNQQKKLCDLEERKCHISSLISSRKETYSGSELETDEDFQQANILLVEIQSEIEEMSGKLREKKPIVTKLAEDIQLLTAKFKV